MNRILTLLGIVIAVLAAVFSLAGIITESLVLVLAVAIILVGVGVLANM